MPNLVDGQAPGLRATAGSAPQGRVELDTERRTGELRQVARSETDSSHLASKPGLNVAAGLITGLLVAAFLVLVATKHDFAVLTKVGQVSAVSFMLLWATLAALSVSSLAGLLVKHRRQLAEDVVGGLIAGLGSGILAALVAAALSGSDFGLGGVKGDAGRLIALAEEYQQFQPQSGSDVYPPGFPIAVAVWSALRDIPAAFAFGHVQIIGTAIAGPVVYGLWRATRGPYLSGALTVSSLAVVMQPSKPYEGLALSMLIPLAIWILRDLREPAGKQVAWYSFVLRGLLVGLTFVTYSGWFYWAFFAIPIWFLALPWRRSWARLLPATAQLVAGFVVGALPYIWMWTIRGVPKRILGDSYFGQGTLQNSAILLPTDIILGGIGPAIAALLAGLALTVMFGPSAFRWVVMPLIISGLLMRLWFAYQMGITGMVQLWPRTGTFLLTVLVVAAIAGFRDGLGRIGMTQPSTPTARLVAFASVSSLLVLLSAGTIGGIWMPDEKIPGVLATWAHLCPDDLCPTNWELPAGVDIPY